ncbi:MAG: hypothetical protein ACI30S_05730 [Muribaculaceae bacterium]
MDKRTMNKVLEVLSAFEKEDWHTAINISGEILAEADTEYNTLRSNKQNTDLEIEFFSLAASYHCMALLFGGEMRMALNTGLISMYQIVQNGYINSDIEQSLMTVCATSLASHMEFCFALEQFEPDDEVKAHCMTIGGYLASYCYHLYNKVNKQDPEYEQLGLVYTILKDAKNLFKIDTPTINVCGHQIDPADATEIMADLLGRAQALGFFDENNGFDED